MRPNETEHSPLSPLDELPIHQIQEPVRVIETTDPRAFERDWFTAQPDSGDFFLVIGFGLYPNLDTCDAYTILVEGGKQTTLRMHRILGDDRSDLTFGPLRAEIVEPFREWRLSVGDNDYGVSLDIRWRDTKRAVFDNLIGWQRGTSRQGHRVPSRSGYETFGRIEGTIELHGKPLDLDSAQVRGSRDHHWGLRNGVGGPGHMEPMPRFSHCGQWVEFSDWSIWGSRCLYNLGDTQHPQVSRVVRTSHKLRFDPVTRHFAGGVIINTLDDGDEKEIHYEQVGHQVAHLRRAGYTGPQGGDPDDGFHHGMFVGADVITGRIDDLSDPDVRKHLGGFDDHLCIARCDGETTVGIIECMNPVLFEMCEAGTHGFALIDN